MDTLFYYILFYNWFRRLQGILDRFLPSDSFLKPVAKRKSSSYRG